MDVSSYLKLPEVAMRLGVSQKTARRYIKSGALPSIFVGNAYRVHPDALAAFVERESAGHGVAAEPRVPKALAPQSMAELLEAAGVADRELEKPLKEFNALFEGLSYEETRALAWRVINARHAVDPIIKRYLEGATSAEERRLKGLLVRAFQYKAIAILAASEAAERELDEASGRGDDIRASEVMDERYRLALVG